LKQLFFSRENLVSRERRESENESHNKSNNHDNGDKNDDDDQGDDGDYDDFEDDDSDLLHKQGRSGKQPRPGNTRLRNYIFLKRT
jgi:hypothetical protein